MAGTDNLGSNLSTVWSIPAQVSTLQKVNNATKLRDVHKPKMATDGALINFTCNVCGNKVSTFRQADLTRETGPCPQCGAIVRLRALAYLVGKALFETDLPVTKWPKRPDLRGVGVSDWPAFANIYSPKFSYVNTQFDRARYTEQPFLDITNPGSEFIGSCDVVSCSEVLEHVEPPIQRAFDGLFAMLKPGGTLVFTVPFVFGKTIEHFPELHDWTLAERNGKRTVFNATVDGRLQEFSPLVFHGGGSSVLEMRVFGRDDLLDNLRTAGFRDIHVRRDVLKYGIRNGVAWSRPITAKR